jgi:hypothetical protein
LRSVHARRECVRMKRKAVDDTRSRSLSTRNHSSMAAGLASAVALFRLPRASPPCAACPVVPAVRVRRSDADRSLGRHPPPDAGAPARHNRGYGHSSSSRAIARDRFEGVASCKLRGPITLTFHDGGINVGGNAALGIVARRARLDKADSRIDPERKCALLAVPPIGQAPVLGSVRSDQQVQAAAIGALARLDLPLRIPANRILERHAGISIPASVTYQQIPTRSWDVSRRWTNVDERPGRRIDRQNKEFCRLR